MGHQSARVDEQLLRAVNGLAASPAWAGLGTVLSSRWMIPLVCGPVLVVLLRQRRVWAILSIALAMGCGDLVASQGLKPVIDRERPCHALSDLVPAAKCGVGRSMPSSHATVAFAFLVSAAPTVRLGWWLLSPLAAGVAGSRVLLGVHYPSDVGAGAVVGSLVGGLAGWLRRKKERGLKASSSSPASCP